LLLKVTASWPFKVQCLTSHGSDLLTLAVPLRSRFDSTFFSWGFEMALKIAFIGHVPPVPANTPTIDYETAKRYAVERILSKLEPSLGTAALIDDAKTEEYEWGWMLSWYPEDPSRLPPEEAKWPGGELVVDRVTGFVHMVGSSGPKRAIFGLMQSRERALKEGRIGCGEDNNSKK
jgi:hypothetical protein